MSLHGRGRDDSLFCDTILGFTEKQHLIFFVLWAFYSYRLRSLMTEIRATSFLVALFLFFGGFFGTFSLCVYISKDHKSHKNQKANQDGKVAPSGKFPLLMQNERLYKILGQWMARNRGQGDGEHLVFQVPHPIPSTGQHQVHYDSWVLPQIPVPQQMKSNWHRNIQGGHISQTQGDRKALQVHDMTAFGNPNWIWQSLIDFQKTIVPRLSMHPSLAGMPSFSPGWAWGSELSVFGEGSRNEVHLGTSLTLVLSPFGHVLDLTLGHFLDQFCSSFGTSLTMVICPLGRVLDLGHLSIWTCWTLNIQATEHGFLRAPDGRRPVTCGK